MIPKPSILDESNIRLAGEGTGMQAQFIGKVIIIFGGYTFVQPICISPYRIRCF